MATLSTSKKDKSKSIQFRFDPKQKKHTIYLGKISKKASELVLIRVEELIAAKISHSPIPTETASWVASIGDKLRNKLYKLGLVDKATNHALITVKELVEQFLKNQVVSPATLAVYKQGTNSLVKHFGAKTLISTIDVKAADKWRTYVEQSVKAKATLGKRIRTVRSVFSKAVIWKMIPMNPFSHLKAPSQQNRSRIHYVSREIIEQVIAECSDAESKAIIGLARFAGLRCPSEIIPLKWKHIDFVAGTIKVTSPKTANSGKDMRIVPIDSDLMKLLIALNPGSSEDPVISKIASKSKNFSGMLLAAIKKSGNKRWERIFQNLRASCEMEWNDKIGNAFAVSDMIGHSVLIAANHYNKVRPSHLSMISGIGLETTQITTQQPPAQPSKDVQTTAEIVDFPRHLPICPTFVSLLALHGIREGFHNSTKELLR